ncbi:hypothetical protein [Amycolatopsis magusensis]|uniref:hypothetical protein n=1 Tax=Amycolatopsis magusensis TaxID=882444 RepID=UPI0037980CB1
MSRVPDGIDLHELTVVARRVLLDGLTALAAHRQAITVVGAQAVHLRTPGAAIAGAAYTSDGDLGLDPCLLGREPRLEEALRAAGFDLMYPDQPGLWKRRESVRGKEVPIELDLLVGSALAKGRRGARLAGHDKMAAHKVKGLEVAVVDRSPMTVCGLDPVDPRAVEVHVAGPAALLVAKAHKIDDRYANRHSKPQRLVDKDAADVLRLMMVTPPDEVRLAFSELVVHERVGAIARDGMELLRRYFGGARTAGVEMAVRALTGDVAEARVRALAPAFVGRLGG